jgi:hypothetical protein
MASCSYCDKEVSWDARFCPSCGKRKPAERITCEPNDKFDELEEKTFQWACNAFGIGGAVFGAVVGLRKGSEAGDIRFIIIFSLLGAAVGGVVGFFAGSLVHLFIKIALVVISAR